MKRCYKCKETKDFTEFGKNKTKKDGYQNQCKACMKRYRDANKAKIAESGKQYRDNNKTKIAEYKKQRILNTIPCVYRIKSKVSGIYYIGSTTQPLRDRISKHFQKTSGLESPFTGKNRDNWEIQQLCTGTKEQVRELEKYMLSTRVGMDKNCINQRVG